MVENDEFAMAMTLAYSIGIHDAPDVSSRAEWQLRGVLAVAKAALERAAEVTHSVCEAKLDETDPDYLNGFLAAAEMIEERIRALIQKETT